MARQLSLPARRRELIYASRRGFTRRWPKRSHASAPARRTLRLVGNSSSASLPSAARGVDRVALAPARSQGVLASRVTCRGQGPEWCPIVSCFSSAAAAGDQPMLLAPCTATVLVGETAAGRSARASDSGRVIVLDEAFNTPSAAYVDCSVRLNPGLAPAACAARPLREPLGSLSRADSIGSGRTALPRGLARAGVACAHALPLRDAATAPRCARHGGDALRSRSWRARARLLSRSRRARFADLGPSGCAGRRRTDVPRSHRFRPGDLAGLDAQAPYWITTEKDAVKLVPAWAGRARVDVLAIELAVEAPDAFLDWIESRLR